MVIIDDGRLFLKASPLVLPDKQFDLEVLKVETLEKLDELTQIRIF